MDGIFFILRAGSPWGVTCPGVTARYMTSDNRWSRDGNWARIIPDLQWFAGLDGDDEDGGGAGSAGGADDQRLGGAGAQARLRLAPGR